MNNYDILDQAEIVRNQLKQDPNPIIEARNLISSAILSETLIALSEIGFYEFIASKETFKINEAQKRLKVDKIVLKALLEYCLGRGLFKRTKSNDLKLTRYGQRTFNIYTRGVLSIYIGGYRKILNGLTSVLKKEKQLKDDEFIRDTRHAAQGTAFATCSFVLPKVFEVINEYNSKCVLDLGCGTGDFLIQFLRLNPNASGVGVDMSSAAIDVAKKRAIEFGLEDRINFIIAEIGIDDLSLENEAIERVDCITSMYMLHEFGRNGRQAIVDVLSALGSQLPGRRLLALEVEGCDPNTFSDTNPKHFGRLDYNLIHILSMQGLPREPNDWKNILKESGCDTTQEEISLGGSFLYSGKFK